MSFKKIEFASAFGKLSADLRAILDLPAPYFDMGIRDLACCVHQARIAVHRSFHFFS
jgi:hypothetical protein